MKLLKLAPLLLILAACTTMQKAPVPAPVPSPPIIQLSPSVVLSWNSPTHPERVQWTTDILAIIKQDISTYASASDITQFRPDFKSLTQDQQIQVVAEIFSSDSYYESSWDPSESDVDVGEQDDTNTYSVGLMQVSQCDQDNYNLHFGFTYQDLLTEKPNLILADAILSQQIRKYGKILIPWSDKSHVYWSSLSPGNKYDSSAAIIQRVQGMQLK